MRSNPFSISRFHRGAAARSGRPTGHFCKPGWPPLLVPIAAMLFLLGMDPSAAHPPEIDCADQAARYTGTNNRSVWILKSSVLQHRPTSPRMFLFHVVFDDERAHVLHGRTTEWLTLALDEADVVGRFGAVVPGADATELPRHFLLSGGDGGPGLAFTFVGCEARGPVEARAVRKEFWE